MLRMKEMTEELLGFLKEAEFENVNENNTLPIYSLVSEKVPGMSIYVLVLPRVLVNRTHTHVYKKYFLKLLRIELFQ